MSQTLIKKSPLLSHYHFCPRNAVLFSMGSGQRTSKNVWAVTKPQNSLSLTFISQMTRRSFLSDCYLACIGEIKEMDKTFFPLNGESINLVATLTNSMSASDSTTVSLPSLALWAAAYSAQQAVSLMWAGRLSSTALCKKDFVCFLASVNAWRSMQRCFISVRPTASTGNAFLTLSIPKPGCLFSRFHLAHSCLQHLILQTTCFIFCSRAPVFVLKSLSY